MIWMGLNPPHSSSRREDMTSSNSPFHYPHQPERFGEEPSRIVHWGSSSWNLAGIAGEESLCSGALTKLGIAGAIPGRRCMRNNTMRNTKELRDGKTWGRGMSGDIVELLVQQCLEPSVPHTFQSNRMVISLTCSGNLNWVSVTGSLKNLSRTP